MYMTDVLNSNGLKISMRLVFLAYMTEVSTGGPKLHKNMLLRMLNENILFSNFVYKHCCRDKMVT